METLEPLVKSIISIPHPSLAPLYLPLAFAVLGCGNEPAAGSMHTGTPDAGSGVSTSSDAGDDSTGQAPNSSDAKAATNSSTTDADSSSTGDAPSSDVDTGGGPSADAGSDGPSGERVKGPGDAFSLALDGLALDCGESTCALRIAGAHVVEDGKLLVFSAFTDRVLNQSVRRWHLFRLEATGEALDESFGEGGRLWVEGADVDGSDQNLTPHSHGLDSAGRIVLLSRVSDGGAGAAVITRHLSDGAVDESFGENGSVNLSGSHAWPSSTRFQTLAVLPDDRILIGGSHPESFGGPRQWMFALLDSDGALDDSLGAEEGFVAHLPPDATSDSALVRLLVAENSVYAVGLGVAGFNPPDETLVARLNPDLSLDETYGDSGFVSIFAGVDHAISDALLDSEGRLVLVGTGAGQEDNVNHAKSGLAYHVYRYLADGSADTDFGEQGRARVDFGVSNLSTQIFDDVPTGLRELPDGRLLISGTTRSRTGSPPATRISMTLLLPDGSLDETFNFNQQRLDSHLTGIRIHGANAAVLPTVTGRWVGIAAAPAYSSNAIQPIIDQNAPIVLQWWE